MSTTHDKKTTTAVRIEELRELLTALETLGRKTVGMMRDSMHRVFAIGEHLARLKAELPHGEYTPALKSLNLTSQTAGRYRDAYENREEIEARFEERVSEAGIGAGVFGLLKQIKRDQKPATEPVRVNTRVQLEEPTALVVKPEIDKEDAEECSEDYLVEAVTDEDLESAGKLDRMLADPKFRELKRSLNALITASRDLKNGEWGLMGQALHKHIHGSINRLKGQVEAYTPKRVCTECEGSGVQPVNAYRTEHCRICLGTGVEADNMLSDPTKSEKQRMRERYNRSVAAEGPDPFDMTTPASAVAPIQETPAPAEMIPEGQQVEFVFNGSHNYN